jgi:type IV secretion system protein VirB10
MIRLPWRRDSYAARPSDPAHAGGSRSGTEASGPPDELLVEPGAPWADGVRGERARSIVSGARSLQSRMTSFLAAGLMMSVGAGMLAWYYSEALSRPASVPARASLPEVAGEGMTLPPFAPATSPRVPKPIAPALGVPSVPTISALRSPNTGQSSPAASLSADPLLGPPLDRAPGGLPPGGVPRGYGAPPPPSPHQQALDRRLSGEVFAGAGSGGGRVGEGPQVRAPAAHSSGDALETLLRPSVLDAIRAQLLPTQRLLLPKGSFIDCTLETAIDSTLPGMTTCITATDTFGADGTVVLLERGTKLLGETRGELRQGDARVFVVWTEARTPAGVVVQLDSPGTDALGRAGLEGEVNRHFWQRFGAAALVSTIDGIAQSEAQSSSRGGTVVLDPSASEDVINEILRSTVNIPPTIRVRNGARIQVLVARDVDFGPVYELEPR